MQQGLEWKDDGDSGRDPELWVGIVLPEPGVQVGEEEAGAVDRRGSRGTEIRLRDSQCLTDALRAASPAAPKGWPPFSLQGRLWAGARSLQDRPYSPDRGRWDAMGALPSQAGRRPGLGRRLCQRFHPLLRGPPSPPSPNGALASRLTGCWGTKGGGAPKAPRSRGNTRQPHRPSARAGRRV